MSCAWARASHDTLTLCLASVTLGRGGHPGVWPRFPSARDLTQPGSPALPAKVQPDGHGPDLGRQPGLRRAGPRGGRRLKYTGQEQAPGASLERPGLGREVLPPGALPHSPTPATRGPSGHQASQLPFTPPRARTQSQMGLDAAWTPWGPTAQLPSRPAGCLPGPGSSCAAFSKHPPSLVLASSSAQRRQEAS